MRKVVSAIGICALGSFFFEAAIFYFIDPIANVSIDDVMSGEWIKSKSIRYELLLFDLIGVTRICLEVIFAWIALGIFRGARPFLIFGLALISSFVGVGLPVSVFNSDIEFVNYSGSFLIAFACAAILKLTSLGGQSRNV